MNSKKIAIGILFLLLTVHLSGCIDKDPVGGTYRCTVDDGVLHLHDGEYEMTIDEKYGGGGSYGEYSTLDNMVILKMEFLGVIIPFRIMGKDLCDPEGDMWIRD